MGKGFFDKEQNIVDLFRDEKERPESICVMTGGQAERTLVEMICDGAMWADTSAKGAPPPDFFSERYNLMMEVMRIDDCVRPSIWGRIGPELEEELAVPGRFSPDVGVGGDERLPYIVVSDRPRGFLKDHNYEAYRNNFRRVVGKHIGSVPIYRKNHPNKKLIFFVRDESCLYFDIPAGAVSSHKRAFEQYTAENAHLWMYDKAFLEPLMGADVDYLVWYTPYKLGAEEQNRLDTYIPTVCMFDLSQLNPSNMRAYKAHNVWPREL